MGGLIERTVEVSAAQAALSAAAAGAGGSVMLAGPAGIGKSALVTQVQELARAAGFLVLSSAATPVSAGLSHGVVRDWFGSLMRSTPAGQPPFDGPAADLAEAMRNPAEPHRVWNLAGLDYALTWALESLAEHRPLLLVVDDVQWADVGSLQLLDLLSARLPQMPVALVLAHRSGETALAEDVVERLSGRATVLEPAPLSVVGVEQVRRDLGTSGALAKVPANELHRLTGGVPFLLVELLRSGSVDQTPRSVVDSVRERLHRLGPLAVSVARMTAALGDDAEFDALADLTGLSVADLADPLEVLTDAGIVSLGMWRVWPAHPLIAEAVLSSLSPSERSELHGAAARYLVKQGRSLQVVASHLLHTLPDEDRAVADLLRSVGEESLRAGAPDVAARQLLRAVGETRPEDTSPDLLALAASAHLHAGCWTEAFDLWSKALHRAEDPSVRAELLADIGDVQMTLGRRTDAAQAYQQAVQSLTEAGFARTSPRVRDILVRMGLTSALYEGAKAEIVDAVTDAVSRPVDQDTRTDRLLFALAASDLAVGGTDRERATELALRALGDGALLAEETSEGIGFYVASGVLSWADAYAENLAALADAVKDARTRGSVLGFATASYCRGFVHYRQGRLNEATAEFQPALDLRERGFPFFAEVALAGAALTRASLGLLEEAAVLEPALRVAAERGQFVSAQPLAVAGLLRALHGDHVQALDDYRGAARLMGQRHDNPSIVEWRELSVWSLAAVGRADEALEVGEEALVHARAWGAPRALGFALRTLARVTDPERGRVLLREAVTLLEEAGCLDYLARARADLGGLLVEGGPAEREEGVELLRAALEHGRSRDVEPVAQRATRLLLKSGEAVAEPVRDPVSLLTPGERRVVELAATGWTNRQIAQELFVTVKAVEWHLSNAYRKLGISSRTDLAATLYGSNDPSSSSEM